MAGATVDPDWHAATDPRTPPQQLADIAARRWDLHAVISAHPQAYPELRRWMAQVNPGGDHTAQAMPLAPVRRPRRGIGWWFAGCGCLAVAGVLVVVIALLGGVGAALQQDGGSRPEAGGVPAPAPEPANDAVAEQLAIFESERARYHQLVAELDGNPVAPLVTQLDFMERVEREAAVPGISEIAARSVAERAREFREELEAEVTAAEARRANASGTLTEQLVDEAGDGFIDVRWDATSACDAAGEGELTTGCVVTGDPLTIHLQSESAASGDWERRMVVAHELAHVYQHADARRFDDGKGDADRLVEQGMFQGSDEKMADCYALTYYEQHTLTNGSVTLGYGYVCNASERQAIREWAAEVNAPMPN